MQTFASNLVKLSEDVSWEDLIEKVTTNPRRLVGASIPVIDVGAEADLTILDPGCTWVLDGKTNLSKAINSPWWGQKVKGKAIAVFCNGKNSANA